MSESILLVVCMLSWWFKRPATEMKPHLTFVFVICPKARCDLMQRQLKGPTASVTHHRHHRRHRPPPPTDPPFSFDFCPPTRPSPVGAGDIPFRRIHPPSTGLPQHPAPVISELTFDPSEMPCLAGLAGGHNDNDGPSTAAAGHGHGHGQGRRHAGGELVLSFLAEKCTADPVFASLLLQLVEDSKRSLRRSARGRKKDRSVSGSGRGHIQGWGTGVDACGDDAAAAEAAAGREERVLAVRKK